MATKIRQAEEAQEYDMPDLSGRVVNLPVPAAHGIVSAPPQTLLRLDQLGSMSRESRRDIGDCFEEAKAMVHLDKEAAKSCSYSLPRGGKQITGPSVRLAEIMQAAWGNITVSVDNFTLEKDDSGRTSIKVWGWAVDTQKNNAVQSFESATVFQKKGKGIDDDAISNAIDRAKALLYRDLIFKVIPKAYTNVVYNEAMTVALGSDKLRERIDKIIERFYESYGVDEKTLLTYLNKPNRSTMDAEDVQHLMGIGTAIKDGHTTIAEVFSPREGAEDEGEDVPADE